MVQNNLNSINNKSDGSCLFFVDEMCFQTLKWPSPPTPTQNTNNKPNLSSWM